MQIDIRRFCPDDAPALQAIYHDAVHQLGVLRYTAEQATAWSPAIRPAATITSRAADGRTTLVAVAGGVVAGFGELETNGHIDMLYRRPGSAYAGVGQELLAALVKLAGEQGIARLYAEASELARGVFERNGFRVVERRDFELRGVSIHNYAVERVL